MSIELDLEGAFKDRVYPILASLVTPRPIALVTTIGTQGQINAAPFSYFNVLGSEPPIVAFTPGDRDDGTPKDTPRNIAANHEFVVNLVDETLAEGMNQCAAPLPYGENELARAGLHWLASSVVRPPRLSEAPASLECVEWDTLRIGANRVVIGLVRRVHVREELFDATTRRIRGEAFFPVGRMASPDWYCRTRERFEMPRPR